MPSTQTTCPDPCVVKAWIRRIVSLLIGLATWGILFFVFAGRVDYPRAWLVLGLWFASMAANAIVMFRNNPVLAAERWKKRQDTKPFDKVCCVLIPLFWFLLPVAAGLELRHAGSPLGEAALSAGIALSVLGMAAIAWTLGTNPHAETTVRIQKDRGHTVTTTGPYRFVRHPMYVGLILQQIGLPLVLGLVWAYLASAALALVLVVRTALEDRTLFRELPGYPEYAAKTRYRLLPGLW